MKKNIWFFHHYASSPNNGALVRPYDFCRFLRLKGYDTNIFASAYNHFTQDNRITGNEKYINAEDEGIPFTFIKNPEYTTNGLDRVKNMVSFFFTLFSVTKAYTKETGKKPDVIIASSPHPLTCIAGLFIAKRYAVPCIVEIRDLWPESIVAYSKKFTKNHPIIKMLYLGEKWIYKKADKLIFTMPGGYDYIKEKGWEKAIPQSKVFHINNGVDLEKFNYNKKHYTIKDADLDNKDTFKVVYTGAIRKANNIGVLLDAAKLVTNKKVQFLIWGGGTELEELQTRVINENIENVHFKGHVEKKYVPYILSKADLNVLHFMKSNLSRFGTSRNKMFDYLASGKAILNTDTEAYDLVSTYNAGITVANQNLEGISSAIESLVNINKSEYAKISKNVQNLASLYDFNILTDTLIKFLEV